MNLPHGGHKWNVDYESNCHALMFRVSIHLILLHTANSQYSSLSHSRFQTG